MRPTHLNKAKVYKTFEKGDSFLIDTDKKGKAVGIEILNYSKSAPLKERFQVSFGRERILIPASLI